MQNAAKKSTVRPAKAVLAVLCFFCAVLAFFLFWTQSNFGSYDNKENRDAVFEMVCGVYSEELKKNVESFFDTTDSEQAPKTMYCPAFLTSGKTNLIISIKDAEPNSKTSIDFVNTKLTQEQKDCLDNPEKAFFHHTYDWGIQYQARSESGRPETRTHNVRVRFALPSAKLIKNDGFYWARMFMKAASALYYPLWVFGVVMMALAILFAVLYLRSALREGRNAQGQSRLFRELSPDLLLIILFPIVVFCTVKIKEWDPTKEWPRILIYGPTSPLLALIPAYITILFGLALFFASIVLFSLRSCGPRGLLSYTRYEKAPFTVKTIPTLLIMQSVKAAAILLYTQVDTFTDATAGSAAAAAAADWIRVVPLPVFLLLEKAVLAPVVYRCLREMRQIASVTDVYVQGDLSPDITAHSYYRSIRDHAQDIDSIVQRIRSSADEYIRSSEFKAEMITNLSHDIKTPLTSIINYASLLQNPQLTPEERARYLDVLARHSRRMSRLVEDLTQVSDAQKGRIESNPAWMDLASVVVQSATGFEERLQGRGITIRFLVPDEPVYIMADARLMWRVSDNLMNNICKYAAPHSEVQIGVSEQNGEVTAFYANTPETPLEISGDALMERFVRADSSRHTEGSGLGLSIARSIMLVQGGELRIETQPDLFTAYIVFNPTEGKGA